MINAGDPSEQDPSLQRVLKEREIYDKGMAFAKAGDRVPIRVYCASFEFEGTPYVFQASDYDPRVFIERRYKDDDGLWWSDLVYRVDPTADELIYVHETITAKAHHIGDLNGMNLFDAPFHGGSFITTSSSPYTYVRDYIREDQPLTDPDELEFVSRLANSAFESMGAS